MGGGAVIRQAEEMDKLLAQSGRKAGILKEGEYFDRGAFTRAGRMEQWAAASEQILMKGFDPRTGEQLTEGGIKLRDQLAAVLDRIDGTLNRLAGGNEWVGMNDPIQPSIHVPAHSAWGGQAADW